MVPAEIFGRIFKEWRDSSPQCKDNEGKYFKGIKCAEMASRDYRLMQSECIICI